MQGKDLPLTVHRLSLTPDIEAAVQSVYNAPRFMRTDALYANAKAIELSCLLLAHLNDREQAESTLSLAPTRLAGLDHARDLLDQQYAEHWTLSRLAKTVGLSKSSLTQGFRQRFGVSVFEHLHQRRMQRASQLLCRHGATITDVSAAVGYHYVCNFSTAFRQYFGVSPKDF